MSSKNTKKPGTRLCQACQKYVLTEMKHKCEGAMLTYGDKTQVTKSGHYFIRDAHSECVVYIEIKDGVAKPPLVDSWQYAGPIGRPVDEDRLWQGVDGF